MATLTRKTRNRLAMLAFVGAATVTVIGLVRARQETIVQLHEREDLSDALEAVLDSSEHGMAIVDERSQVLLWNPALEQLTGWSEEEVKVVGLAGIMPETVFPRHDAAFAKAFAAPKEERKVSVVRCVTRGRDDKSPVSVRITVRLIEGRHGKAFAWAHVDREVEIEDVPRVYISPETARSVSVREYEQIKQTLLQGSTHE